MNSFEFCAAGGHVLSLPFFTPFVHASGCILMRHNVAQPLWKYQRRHAATRINTMRVICWILKRNFLKTNKESAKLVQKYRPFWIPFSTTSFIMKIFMRLSYIHVRYFLLFFVQFLYNYFVERDTSWRMTQPCVSHVKRYDMKLVCLIMNNYEYARFILRHVSCANLSARYNWSAAFSFAVNHRINGD